MKRIVSTLEELGIELVTGVPDSMLSGFVHKLQENSSRFHLQVASNEGSAIALAAGHFLGSGKPALVYMQNSGLPNALNPLTSLAHEKVYGIPMVLIIGWRGSFNDKGEQLPDEPQHLVQGSVTRNQLSDLGIPFEIASTNLEVTKNQISRLHSLSIEAHSPTALLVGPGIFDAKLLNNADQDLRISSESAIRETINLLEEKAILVGSTGMIGRELLKISNESRDFPHKLFMNVGAMGHTSAIAKGIALAKKKTKVICFDGDGSLAMHFGSLAMLNDLPNFKHILINNFAHDSVGGGRTSFGDHDLSVVLDNFNFGRYQRVLNLNQDAAEKVKMFLNNRESCMIEFICRGRDSHSLPRPTKTLRELAANFQLDF